MPCDTALPDADETYGRAVDVDAPPERVFRWLCQLRAAPYSYDWIDNGGRTSPRNLTDGLEDLAVGQRVMTIFTLTHFAYGQHVTLRMNTGDARLFGAISVTYAALPLGDNRTRLYARLRVRYPRSVRGWLMRWLLPLGDAIMMRKQLITLKYLAEGG